MANQRQIARALGISQSAVSCALRNHPNISREVREKVLETAGRLGYRQNAYLSAVMKEARTGRKTVEKGGIALIVDNQSREKWYGVCEASQILHKSVIARAAELGFGTETFYLRAPGMSLARLDRFLRERGTQGIVLLSSIKENYNHGFEWSRYACVASGCWYGGHVDRVCSDQVKNVINALDRLKSYGYGRVGMILNEMYTQSDGLGTKWGTGYLGYQNKLPKHLRIPLLSGDIWTLPAKKFHAWYLKWKPQVLLTLVGHEERWTTELGLAVPEEVGIACMDRPSGGHFAGIEPTSRIEGALLAEMLAAKLGRNEYGLSRCSIQTVVEGRWVDGETVAVPRAPLDSRTRTRARSLDPREHENENE